MRVLLLLWSWLKSTVGADLDFLLSTLFNKLQHQALQALPCSHPPLIKACSHRDISPHRQCLFSRCCQVPFFTLISSLKLFFNPRTPCLPSFSFLCEGCQRWQLVAGRDLWEEKEGALLQRAAAWLHLTHAVTQNSLTRARTDSHADKVTHPASCTGNNATPFTHRDMTDTLTLCLLCPIWYQRGRKGGWVKGSGALGCVASCTSDCLRS